MRIAAIADIHGNLPALNAVLADIERNHVDIICNLGDCVSGPLWPHETWERLQTVPMRTVRGNHDRAAGLGESPLGASDRFARECLTAAQLQWLAELPFAQEFDGARCFHANPLDDTGYFIDVVHDGQLRLAPADQMAAALGRGAPALVLCGHSHQPRLVRLGSGTVVVNPGSVGCPAYLDPGPPAHRSETGSPHARYAILILNDGAVQAEFRALPYDWEQAARRAAANGRPEWAHALRTGYAE